MWLHRDATLGRNLGVSPLTSGPSRPPPSFSAFHWLSPGGRGPGCRGSRSAARCPRAGTEGEAPQHHCPPSGDLLTGLPTLPARAQPLCPRGSPWGSPGHPEFSLGDSGYGNWSPERAPKQREEALAPEEGLVLAWPLPGPSGQVSDLPAPPAPFHVPTITMRAP